LSLEGRLSWRPLSFCQVKIEQRKLNWALVENPRELLSEIIHIVAQLHNRNDALDLIVNFIAAKFLQPLMMVP
jgi:hypothetical protein